MEREKKISAGKLVYIFVENVLNEADPCNLHWYLWEEKPLKKKNSSTQSNLCDFSSVHCKNKIIFRLAKVLYKFNDENDSQVNQITSMGIPPSA